MKKTMKRAIFILILLPLFLFSCNREERNFLDTMNAMYEGHFTTEELRNRERELRESIRKNRRILEQRVDAARSLAGFHQMLGRLYLEHGMFLLAAQEFEEALKVTTESPVLLYYAGLSYARYAKSLIDEALQLSYLLLAEKYYLKAIEFNNNFARALYAVAVLYIFEFDQPDRAVYYLEHLLETQRSDVEAMFLLANAYIRLGLYNQAVAQYDNIIRTSMSTVHRRQAEENKRQIQGGFRWN
ncbi:MAG: hypothetical protein FWD87_00765 [Spirochaetaceae bacterium]|nr:hypothetical protein [Spirochaetaceae bacterium]